MDTNDAAIPIPLWFSALRVGADHRRRSGIACASFAADLRLTPVPHAPPQRSRFAPVIRLIVRTIVALVANAVGLLIAAAVLDDMHLNASGFIVAVVVFTVVFAGAAVLMVQLRRAGSAALGGVARITTLVSLIITDLISDASHRRGRDVDARGGDRVVLGADRCVHPAVHRAEEVLEERRD